MSDHATGEHDQGPVVGGLPQARPPWWRVSFALILAVLAFGALLVMATWFDDELRRRKELDALLTLAFFLILGLAAISFVHDAFPHMDLGNSKLLMALMLVIPLLGFLVLTDRITTISGAGVAVTVNTSLGQTNLNVGQLPVDLGGTPVGGAPAGCLGDQPAPFTVPQQQQEIVPDPATEIPDTGFVLAPVATTPITVQLGPTNYWRMTLEACTYDYLSVKSQFEQVIATGAFRFILLVYGTDHFFAYIPAGTAARIFATDGSAYALVYAINNDPDLLKSDPQQFEGIVFNTLDTTDTTIEALTRMREQNLDMLPIVDTSNDVQGVTSWSQVLTSMMLELATSVRD